MLSRTSRNGTRATAVVAALCVLMATLVLVVGPGTDVAEAQTDVGGLPDPSACYGVADEAFGDSGGAPDGLSVISRFGGATSNIGGETGTTDIEAIAFGPGTIVDPALAQQVLYTFDGTDFGYLNLTTGTFTSLGLPAPDGFATVDGMTWDPQLNVFWVTDRIGDDGVADRVAAYDPTTGATTIGPFSTGIATDPAFVTPDGAAYDDFDDIALDPTEFRLYAILNKGGTGGGLVELSKTDGSVIDYIGVFTPVDAASDFDGDGVTDDMEGLAFFNDGNLYGSTGANGPGADINRFYSIDLATGATSWIADFTDYGDYEALACLTVEAFIDVEKGTAEPAGTPEDADVAPGPTITTPSVEWTYEITNESLSLDLANVQLVDDQIAGVLFDQATGETQCAEGVILAAGDVLAPQASVTCTVTGSTITGPYTNTATVTGQADPGNGLALLDLIDEDPSNYLGAPISDPPVLEVVKTAVAGAGADCAAATPVPGDGELVSVAVGETVTFCVTVSNVGGTPASNVTVTDNNATPADTADDFVVAGLDGIDLAEGASATGSFEVTVTSLTATLNTVGATGTDPATGEPTNEPTDTAQVIALGTPVLEVVKTAVAGASDCTGVTAIPGDDAVTVAPGTEVTFCITVTNSGNAPATDVTVVDDNLTPNDPTDDVTVTGLDGIALGAGESASGALVVTATAAGTNTVTASGTDPNTGQPTNQPTDPAGILLLGPPELAVIKTAVAGTSDCVGVTPAAGQDAITVAINSTVTYCVTVTNIGETPATAVTVTDDNLTPTDTTDDVDVPGLIDITLAAGESATGALEIAATAAGVNTVTAVGTDPFTNQPTNEPTDPAEVLLLGPPELTVVKTAVAGANVDCAAVTPAPGLDEIPTTVGAEVTFCITVSNIGETPAEQVTVTDDNFTPGDTSDDQVIAGLDNITLAAGASATGSFTYTVASQAELQNTVTATGVDPNTGQPTNEPTDDAGILPPQGNAELDVVKTAVVGANVDCAAVAPAAGQDVKEVKIGDSVTFCVTVSNVGTGPASNVVVIDNNFTPTNTADDTPVVGLNGIDLAAGASATGSIVFTVTELGSKTNIVAATGTDVNANVPTNEPTDPAGVVPFGTPILTVVKTAVKGTAAEVDCATVNPASGLDEVPVSIGDSVTYCIVVTNTGNGPATDVKAIDDNFTPTNAADDVVVAEVAELAPGATLVGSFTRTVTSAVAQKNTAKATGTDPVTGGPTNEPTDPAGKVTPAIDLVKQILRGPDQAAAGAAEGVNELIVGQAGDSVTWVYTVTNTGSTALIVTEIVDPSLGITVPLAVGDQLIAPGGSVSVTANGVVTAAGATSEASVQGQPADAAGLPITGFDPLTAANDAAEGPASISLTKQILRGNNRDCSDAAEGVNESVIAEPGDAITWCFVITNTGVSSLTNVVFTDQDLNQIDIDVLAETGSPTLAPGASITRSANDTVDSGGAVNVASVAAVPSDPTGGTTNPAFAGAPTLQDTNTAENDSIEIRLEKRVLLGFDADCDTAIEGRDEGVKGRLGDDVTWCFTAINTGSVALRVTEIVDETLDVVLPIPEAEQVLVVSDPQASVTVQLNGTIDRDTTINTASVEGSPVDPVSGAPIIDAETGEPVPSINDTNTATKAPTTADLRLTKTKTLPEGGAKPGDIVDYQVVIENKGPDTALDVEMLDKLPAGLEYVETPVVAGWECSINPAGNELLCERDRLRVGVIETIAYKVRITESAPTGVDLVNTATVGFSGVDPTPEDNTDTESIDIPGPTPVTITRPLPRPIITNPPPDEVRPVIVTPPLAVTGSNSNVLVAVANVSILLGGVFMVLARRRSDESDALR